jgi:hypothetical protein
MRLAWHARKPSAAYGQDQDVDAILEKEYLHAKNVLSAEHVFSALPVMPSHYSIRPHASKLTCRKSSML